MYEPDWLGEEGMDITEVCKHVTVKFVSMWNMWEANGKILSDITKLRISSSLSFNAFYKQRSIELLMFSFSFVINVSFVLIVLFP